MGLNYSEFISDKILITPAVEGQDTLCILAHMATPSMASWLLKTYEELNLFGISVQLTLTFPKESSELIILENDHNGFKELQKRFRNNQNVFSCSYYYGREEHQKNIYVWLKNQVPDKAFITDCDFTQQSVFHEKNYSVTEYNPLTAYQFYLKTVNDSIYCDNSEAEDYIVVRKTKKIEMHSLVSGDSNVVTLPLIIEKTGEPGQRSGLNWGQRAGRNPNEAYIPLSRKVAQSGFFPLNKQHFLVVTDDHHTLQLRVEQQGDKAITTPASNAQLGEYFRNRLGLANGVRVSCADLDLYGRHNVSFYKIDDEQFYMDFSVAQKEKDGR